MNDTKHNNVYQLVPEDVVQAACVVEKWAAKTYPTNNWRLCGLASRARMEEVIEAHNRLAEELSVYQAMIGSAINLIEKHNQIKKT